MDKKYFVYELDDYFAPDLSSGVKHYFGTDKDLLSVYLASEETEGTEVTVLKEKTIELSEELKFIFLNAYDCRYEIEFSGLVSHIYLVKFNEIYIVFAFAEIKNPRYRAEAPFGDYPDDFSYLENRFWGLPGQIDKKEIGEEDFILFNHLGYVEKSFSDKNTIFEAIDYFENITVPNLQGFFEDVFGDGETV